MASRAAKWRWQLAPLLIPAIILSWLAGTQLTAFFQEYTPATFAVNPILPDEASIRRGQELYTANCVPCHGLMGQGDGPEAAKLSPPPADFTAGHTSTHPDGDLFYWIKEGYPDSDMPAFGPKLPDEDIWHLVNYVRRLSAPAGQMQMESSMP
jgi:putative copper resistance protein D